MLGFRKYFRNPVQLSREFSTKIVFFRPQISAFQPINQAQDLAALQLRLDALRAQMLQQDALRAHFVNLQRYMNLQQVNTVVPFYNESSNKDLY